MLGLSWFNSLIPSFYFGYYCSFPVVSYLYFYLFFALLPFNFCYFSPYFAFHEISVYFLSLLFFIHFFTNFLYTYDISWIFINFLTLSFKTNLCSLSFLMFPSLFSHFPLYYLLCSCSIFFYPLLL